VNRKRWEFIKSTGLAGLGFAGAGVITEIAKKHVSIPQEKLDPAPDFVKAELTRNPDLSKIMIHLLNYSPEKDNPVKQTGISIRVPRGKQVTELRLLSPDFTKIPVIRFKNEGGKITFTVPILDTYDLIVLNLTNK
jgi:hypothetical protein